MQLPFSLTLALSVVGSLCSSWGVQAFIQPPPLHRLLSPSTIKATATTTRPSSPLHRLHSLIHASASDSSASKEGEDGGCSSKVSSMLASRASFLGMIGMSALMTSSWSGRAVAEEGATQSQGPKSKNSIRLYLQRVDKLNYKLPDFQKGLCAFGVDRVAESSCHMVTDCRLEWVNCPPLSLNKELRGKIVLLDFWTYCCINCMHILPSLARLEKKYEGQAFAVVGSHSAKFQNEKVTGNIRDAVARYGIQHPVVNDKDLTMWNAVGVSSWPTLAMVGPRGNLLAIWSGEGHEQEIDDTIQAALDYYKDQSVLDASTTFTTSLDTTASSSPNPNSPLKYPGKVYYDPASDRLFVSDSSNHRIVVLKPDGSFVTAIGSATGEPGFQDGDFESARFNNPQGLTMYEGQLYVADTDNHAVRVITPGAKTVKTLVGTGEQGRDYSGGGQGRSQALSSPWDVLPCEHPPGLFVAMAGTHQIWRVDPKTGKASCFSGTGYERDFNSNDRTSSAWAQPSGLALSLDQINVYVADSESSSIRELSLAGSCPTRTVVGGSGRKEGDNLFAFGDVDGQGVKAKLQHPLGLASIGDHTLLVADTYNHRLKVVDTKANIVKGLVGTGKAGFKDGVGSSALLAEPAGLSVDTAKGVVYVADTNNHAIRVLDLPSNKLTTLALKDVPNPSAPSTTTTTSQRAQRRSIVNRRRAQVVDLETPINRNGKVTLSIGPLPPNCEYTKGRPSLWQLVDPEGILEDASGGPQGKINLAAGGTTTIDVRAVKDGVVELETAVYYCQEDDGVCRTSGVVTRIPVSAAASKEVVRVTHVIQPSNAKRTTLAETAAAIL